MSILPATSPVVPVSCPFPDVYPDESPELPDSAYEATDEDRRWWAAHDHEEESELDAWLDGLAPDGYERMEGGAL